jgi:hypothetical protein
MCRYIPGAVAARCFTEGIDHAAVFQTVPYAAVCKAVGGGNPDVNPVAAGVTRLAVAYLAAFKCHADRYGNAPPTLPVPTRWPIAKVAMLLVVSFMQAEGGAAFPFTLQ